MTGIEIIAWAYDKCVEQKLPPTDSAMIRMIRFHLIDVQDAEKKRREAARADENRQRAR